MRSVAKFSKRLILFAYMERLPEFFRKLLVVVFWGYHCLVFALFFLEVTLKVIEPGTALPAAQPIITFWGIYAAIFLFLYLPSNALHSLYRYLRDKNLPPSHSVLIATLALFGAVALLLLYRFVA